MNCQDKGCKAITALESLSGVPSGSFQGKIDPEVAIKMVTALAQVFAAGGGTDRAELVLQEAAASMRRQNRPDAEKQVPRKPPENHYSPCWEEGLFAAIKDRQLADNPYEKGSRNWQLWQDGFVQIDK